MSINVNEPLSSRANLVGLVLCLLAILALVVCMHFARPYLDARSREKFLGQQPVEAAVRKESDSAHKRQMVAARECLEDSDDCDPSKRGDELDKFIGGTDFQGRPVPER